MAADERHPTPPAGISASEVSGSWVGILRVIEVADRGGQVAGARGAVD